MLKSMTGFGVENLLLRDTLYSIEIKSLNSKGIDFSFKSPSLFRNLEIDIKNAVQSRLERGKIELNIAYRDSKKGFLTIDKNTFVQQYQFLDTIAKEVNAESDLFSIVVDKYSSMVEVEDLSEEETKLILSTIHNVCLRVDEYRKQEGIQTENDILNWLESIHKALSSIANVEPSRKEARSEKLLQGIQEFAQSNEIDYNRLGQEVIYYIEKLDISEEISRLTEHLRLFKHTLSLNESIGKKLGFISQEMGREINTIGSKANDVEIQHLVVEMKDLLERIKEQLNNIV